MGVEFRVLGPVGPFDDADQPVRLGPRQQALLAALLLEPNQLIPRDQLIDHVWGDKPTTRPENAIHNQLTLLRKALAHIPDVAITWRGGYRLTVDEASLARRSRPVDRASPRRCLAGVSRAQLQRQLQRRRTRPFPEIREGPDQVRSRLRESNP